MVSSNLLHGHRKRHDDREVPSVVFTVQPLATVVFKTIVDVGTDRIVRAQLPRPNAAHVINILGVVLRLDLTAADLKHTLHEYPTSTSDVSYML